MIFFFKEEKGKKNSDLQPAQLSSTGRPCHKVYIEGQTSLQGFVHMIKLIFAKIKH